MIRKKSKPEKTKLISHRFHWRRFAIGLVLTPFLAITSLELLSLYHKCPSNTSRDSRSLPACDSEIYANDTKNQELLVTLKDRYIQGVLPAEEELQQAVFEIDRELIGGNNCIACNGVAFVSNDLPDDAKLFVKRHELEHIFQNLLHRQDKNREFSANQAAAKEYPIGLVSTTIFSIIKSRASYPSFLCYVIGLWNVFKIYFLP